MPRMTSEPPFGIRRETIVHGTVEGYPLTLDLFLPDQATATPRPAVALLHGGGWTFGISGPLDMAESATRFAEAGIVAATVAYRRTREPGRDWRWPDPFRDCQRAVRWLRIHADHYGIDPDCIVAYGHSAGGHLAAMLAVRDDFGDSSHPGISSRVNGSIVVAGHMDLRIPYEEAFSRESLATLLGCTPDEAPDHATDVSPITWVNGDAAPMLMLWGTADHQVAPVQHRSMATALQAAGIPTAVVEIPGADHFTIADWACTGPWAHAFVSALATGFGHRTGSKEESAR